MGTWTDTKGRQWATRMTVRSLCRFEMLTGRKLLEEAFQAWNNKPDASQAGMTPILQFVSGLFRDVFSIAAFLYCLSYEEVKAQNITLDDFSAAIDAKTLPSAIACATEELLDFFRTATAGIETMMPKKPESQPDRGASETPSN